MPFPLLCARPFQNSVERMVFNGHSRSGVSECWEKKLLPNATAREREEREDAFVETLPLEALWMITIMFAVVGLVGLYFGGPENPVVGFLGIFLFGVPFFAVAALLKQDRYRFWRALDKINSLDLRRPPSN